MDHVIKHIIVIIFMYLIYLSSKINIRFILSYHSTIIFDVTLILHNLVFYQRVCMIERLLL